MPSSPALAVSTACPWVGSAAPISQRVSKLLAKMTVAQKVALLTGTSGSRYVGFVPAIGSLCVPALKMEDGPAGVGDGMTGVTQLPAAVDVAATWDTSAEQTYGHLIGAEQAAKGTTVDLGTTINIVRDPRWGRAFESIGEDPYLNGTMGAANIRGVQSTGVMAMVKHLAVYNQETNRNTAADNAVVRNQATQEIYLPAFQAAVQQGAASSVMGSYSYINGTAACQNPYTLRLLRHQDGFYGLRTAGTGPALSPAAAARAAPRRERRRQGHRRRRGPAGAVNHCRRAPRSDRGLPPRRLGLLGRCAGRGLQHRDRVRQLRGVGRQRPYQHRFGQQGGFANLRSGCRQPAHDRRTEHRVSGHDAVAILRRRGARGLVSGPGGWHSHRLDPVRQHRSVRPPASDLSNLAIP